MLVGSACSLATSFDGLADPSLDAGPPVDGSDPSSPEAAALSDASEVPVDAGVEAGENIHPRGTFEDGCVGWYNYQSTFSTGTLSHDTPGSCRVCSNSGAADDVFTADDDSQYIPPTVGAHYRAEAWVRADPSDAVTVPVWLVIRVANRDPFKEHETGRSANVLPNETWQRLEAEVEVVTPGAAIDVHVGGKRTPGACFLLDDVRVERLN